MKDALRISVSLAVVLAILLSSCPVMAASAVDITRYCKLISNSNGKNIKYATDGEASRIWTGAKSNNQRIEIRLNTKAKVGGLYFKWNTRPPKWELFGYDSKGAKKLAATGQNRGYLTEYVAIPGAMALYKRFLLFSSDASKAFSIAELTVYSTGTLPYYVPRWEPCKARTDILLFAAHPDDEQLYLGSVMPTYVQEGRSVQTVFMTYGNSPTSVRRYEAMESVWSTGERTYPVVRSARDVKTTTKEQAMKYWPEKETLGFVVEQIRRFKPSIIVTHDIMGEYWHGAHRLTCYLVQKAFAAAADPKQYSESAKKYGTWKTGKLYIHLYRHNRITIRDNIKLSRFGNKTAFQVEMLGYKRHISQGGGKSWGRQLKNSGAYSNIQFGLYASNVGLDRYHRTMFENVTEAAMLRLNPQYGPSPKPSPTAVPSQSPTATATPTPVPAETPVPTPEPTETPAEAPTAAPTEEPAETTGPSPSPASSATEPAEQAETP